MFWKQDKIKADPHHTATKAEKSTDTWTKAWGWVKVSGAMGRRLQSF
jgi:hypothetical protein